MHRRDDARPACHASAKHNKLKVYREKAVAQALCALAANTMYHLLEKCRAAG